MAFQIRRGTEAQRQALTGIQTPLAGELLFSTDTKKLYIGDGTTTGGVTVGYFGAITVGSDTVTASGNNNGLTLIAGTNTSITASPSGHSITIGANNGNVVISGSTISTDGNNLDLVLDPHGTGKVSINGGLAVTNGAITGDLTGNVTGNVSGSAGTATTVTGSTQSAITSVGTLTSLTVSGGITGTLSGNASSATTAGSATTVTGAAQSAITSVGTLTGLTVSGTGRITFGQGTLAAPTFNTISGGAKITLYDNIGANSATYSLGVESNAMWFSTESTTDSFKWYGGITPQMELTDGTLRIRRLEPTTGFNNITLVPRNNGYVDIQNNLTATNVIIGERTGTNQASAVIVATFTPKNVPLNCNQVYNEAVPTVLGGFTMSRARGTPLSPQVVQVGDIIHNQVFAAYSGPGNGSYNNGYEDACYIGAYVDAAPISPETGFAGRLEFWAKAPNGDEGSRLSVHYNKIVAFQPIKSSLTAGTANIDVTDTAITLSIGDTVDFNSFSGSVMVNCQNSGTVSQYLCGGGGAPICIGSSKVTQTGTMSAIGGGYRFTATETGVHTFYAVKTRNGA
jgi:hypothetical protein